MGKHQTYQRPSGHIKLPQLSASRPRCARFETYVRTCYNEHIVIDLDDAQGAVRGLELVHQGLRMLERINLVDCRAVDGGTEDGAILTHSKILDPCQVGKRPDDAYCIVARIR